MKSPEKKSDPTKPTSKFITVDCLEVEVNDNEVLSLSPCKETPEKYLRGMAFLQAYSEYVGS